MKCEEEVDMKVVLIGLGYWGPNLFRTFFNMGSLAAAFDINEKALKNFATNNQYKDVFFDTDWERCLGKKDVQGVVIATPPHTHYEIAKKAIMNGKHVFIEKPMTLDVKEAEKIQELAEKHKSIVMVGHIFLYSPEILKLKEIISNKAFGKIRYIYTKRLNLGKVQSPANVIEDLAPHDISIIDFLLEDKCKETQVFAKAHILEGSEDVAFINMKYQNGVICNLHLSWLDPLKIRSLVVVGEKQMAVCESAPKKITLYNKSVDIDEEEAKISRSFASHMMLYKYGDAIIPYLENYEPLMKECQVFIDAIKTNKQPLSSAEVGVSVVKTLSAMQRSLKEGGKWAQV